MIFNVRGGPGSGKSHIVEALVQHLGILETIPDSRPGKKHELGYKLSGNIRVLGRYGDINYGGCDSLGSAKGAVDFLEAQIREWALEGHALFEGRMVSSIYGRWTAIPDFVWVFMDTPLLLCAKNIQKRNGGKPVNEEFVGRRWNECARHQQRAIREGHTVEIIRHEHNLEDMLDILQRYKIIDIPDPYL